MAISLIPHMRCRLYGYVNSICKQRERAVMYITAILSEWQMCGKICYSFCRPIRATMWRMVGRYEGNKRTRIVVRFRADVGIVLWQMAQVELVDSLARSARPVISFVS